MFDDEIIEALTILTNQSEGDVRLQIEEGKYMLLTQEALKNFMQDYSTFRKRPDTDPIPDVDILKECLKECHSELAHLKKTRGNKRRIRDLEEEIQSLSTIINSRRER